MKKFIKIWLVLLLLFNASPSVSASAYSFRIDGGGTVQACSNTLSELELDASNFASCPRLPINIYTADSKPLPTSFHGVLQKLRNRQGTGDNPAISLNSGQSFIQLSLVFGSDQTGTWQLAVLDDNSQQVSATKTITVTPSAIPTPTPSSGGTSAANLVITPSRTTLRACATEDLSLDNLDQLNCDTVDFNTANFPPDKVGALLLFKQNSADHREFPFRTDSSGDTGSLRHGYRVGQEGGWRGYVVIYRQASMARELRSNSFSLTVNATGQGGSRTGGGSGSGNNGGNNDAESSGIHLVNPLRGANDLTDIFGIIANFIFNLGVPVAVIIIIYSGIRMLISGGKPANYQKGLNGLKYSLLGLAVLLIGKGFFSLIKTFLGAK